VITTELSAIAAQDPGPSLSAFLALGRAEVHRLHARFDEARRAVGEAQTGFGSLGTRIMTATCQQTLATIELAARDAEAGRDALLRADAIVSEFGERSLRSSTQAMLARVHQRLGALEAARTAVDVAESLSGRGELLNLAITHGVRALLALSDGVNHEAERWARSALQHADRTDFVDLRAQARLVLAEVLAARDDASEARLRAAEALELYEAKGDRPGRAVARAALDALPPV
jgi:hypothetical protein